MSLASQAADAREQAAPQAVTQAEAARSNRFAKLRLHLANIYRLTIKELRSIRSDPIMLAACRLCLHLCDLRRGHRRLDRSDQPLRWHRRRRPFRSVTPHRGWPHAAHFQAGSRRLQRRKSTRR